MINGKSANTIYVCEFDCQIGSVNSLYEHMEAFFGI